MSTISFINLLSTVTIKFISNGQITTWSFHYDDIETEIMLFKREWNLSEVKCNIIRRYAENIKKTYLENIN